MLFEKIGIGATEVEAFEDAKAQLNAPEDVIVQQEILQQARKRLFKSEPAKVRAWYEIPDAKPVQEKPAQKAFTPKKNTPLTAPAQTQAKPAEKSAAPLEKPVSTTVKETVKTSLPIDENDAAVKYLKLILGGMNITGYTLALEKDEAEDEYIYTVCCQNEDGILIGRRGETLDAIQYLMRLSVNRGMADEKHRKVSVNIGNYREKRNDNLRAIAEKHARQVLKYGRNAVLEPMNPYERRIIHTAIQEIEGVTSHSVGFDAGRKVVISLEEGVKPTNPSKGGYNNNRSGGYNNNRPGGYNNRSGDRRPGGGKPPYQKREPYQPSQTRAPRKDVEGSLYGRIDVKKDEN